MAAIRVHVCTKIPYLFETFESMSKVKPNLKITNAFTNVTDKSSSDKAINMDLLKEAEILLADPKLLCGVAQQMPKIKWMQSTWTGIDSLSKKLDPNLPLPSFKLTRLGGVFNTDISEYVVMHIIARERKYKEILKEQESAIWNNKERCQYRKLSSLSIAILGLGEIGKEVARACSAMNMSVTGIARRQPETMLPFVNKYSTLDHLPEILDSHDYICNVLPSTHNTRGLLSGTVLQAAHNKKPCFINVGRGDVIDEESLVKALREQWISDAVLDVFNEEPLPATSVLWSLPNVTITPHVAGVSVSNEDIVRKFYENFERFTSGQELKYQIDWTEGY